MYKEILEKQLDTLTGLQDDLLQAVSGEGEQSANGFQHFKGDLPTALAVAAEIRQTAETLARCEYHEKKRGAR